MLRAMVVSYSSFIARNDDWAGDGLPCQDMMDVMRESVCAANVWEFGLVEVVCRIGRCGVRVGSARMGCSG